MNLNLIDLTPLINAAIAIIAAIALKYLVPWLKAKLGEVNYNTMTKVVETLVTSAEQLYKGSGRGEEKLQYVIKQLEQRGYTVDRDEIEASVKKLFNSDADKVVITSEQ